MNALIKAVPIQKEDAAFLSQLLSNKKVNQFLDIPEADFFLYYSSQHRVSYIILNDNDSVGFFSAHIVSKHKTAIITFALDNLEWNKGIMSHALKTCFYNLRNNYSIVRIEAQVCIKNTASMYLLEKLGFVREGVLHKNFMIQNKLEDSVMLAYITES